MPADKTTEDETTEDKTLEDKTQSVLWEPRRLLLLAGLFLLAGVLFFARPARTAPPKTAETAETPTIPKVMHNSVAGLKGVSAKTPIGGVAAARGDNATDDTDALNQQQRLSETKALPHILDTGSYVTSAPLRLLDFHGNGAPLILRGAVMANNNLSATAGNGIYCKASGNDAVLTVGDGITRGNVISDLTFAGLRKRPGTNIPITAGDGYGTTYGFHAIGHNWSVWNFDRVQFSDVDTDIFIDSGGGTHGGNGEGLNVTDSLLSARKTIYNNASASGQAYYHRFVDDQGGTANGGIEWIIGSQSGGDGVYVFGWASTQAGGPRQNVFFQEQGTGGPCVWIGGRNEHTDTVVQHVFHGSVNENGTLHFQDIQWVGMDTYAAQTGAAPYPLIYSAAPCNGCQYTYVFDDCEFSPAQGSGGHPTPYLWVDIARDDNSRYVFHHCKFWGWSAPPAGKAALTGSGAPGAHRGIVLDDCWQVKPGTTKMLPLT